MLVTRRDTDGGRPAPRLVFLDGLRGLAAVYVVLHHAALMVPPDHLAGLAVPARFLLRHGRYAVAVFIVLSGFCLMLPVARDPEARLTGGVLGFLARRARRILPAYYAALAACWLLIAAVPGLARPDQARWDRALPVAGGGVVTSHLFLVHNLSGRWLFKIDPPMWSVATEWQVYLVFPALLWLWRRAGLATTVSAGFALGVAVAALAVPLNNPALRELCPWYLGLFTLGMSAAVASGGARPSAAPTASPGVRRLVAAVMMALVLAGLFRASPRVRYLIVADALISAATAGLLARWSRRSSPESRAARPPLVRLFESRWAVAAGAISYSLYLVHYPLLALADVLLRGSGAGPVGRFWALTLVASPLCLLAACAFHAAFERPFLAGRVAGGTRPGIYPKPQSARPTAGPGREAGVQEPYRDHRREP